TGDFDICVRLAGLDWSDLWAEAGLMARETLDPGSRFAAALATPGLNGTSFQVRDPAYSPAHSMGTFPANYPNTWLRLQRAGNIFSGYASYDGQIWTPLGSNSIAMPSQIHVGLAVSSHATNQATFAQFRDIAEVTTNSAVGLVTNPHEPLGPSSRKTPLIISEICYKPAPRPDTNNLEFIELYNSNPWFQDIGGYQLKAENLAYTFPPGTLLPGGAFLVVAASPQNLQSVYGLTNVVGPYSGSLKKSDTLQLLDEQGAVLLTVPYSSQAPWPVAAQATGHSLILANPSYGEADPKAWDISDQVGGSPGQMEAYRPSPLRQVLINEFLAHTDPPDYDYIELYNHANAPVDISGCILTDDPTTNKFLIPAGTLIPARGFVAFYETNMGFALNAAGETLYFKNPDQSRILDAVSFKDQENGVATGRWPDGAEAFYRLSAKTPGAANASVLISQVVINELMYHPISGNDDDQYVELYNRGTNAVDLSGWTLSDAVSFTFPSNTVLAADGYLVVARNLAWVLANYPNLTANNSLGDFNGKLSHQGDHLALTQPDTIVSTNSSGKVETNLIHIVVDEVTYGVGGRWGQWADGGGSSLELIDPGANHCLAANWADSDETHKSSWVNIETTGVLDNGRNYDPFIHYAQIGLLDSGECLVDNIEVHPGTAATNYVLNPDFETGLTNWTLQGCHLRSSLEEEGYASGHSLHIRADNQMFTGDNSCELTLCTNAMAAGQTATLRFKARWLRGWPEVLLRLNGNWLEATGR
ncbi:MAG TPA: lamin tail domain-containing protein, partial [Candidatus Sulfotelmatobacter sp.]|nr:lamin tail domain-containing protein [Candidatus Sulfotelmatobacter sp.]